MYVYIYIYIYIHIFMYIYSYIHIHVKSFTSYSGAILLYIASMRCAVLTSVSWLSFFRCVFSLTLACLPLLSDVAPSPLTSAQRPTHRQ